MTAKYQGTPVVVYNEDGTPATLGGIVAGDIEIGAVEIKDGTTDNRAAVLNTNPLVAASDYALVTRVVGLLATLGEVQASPTANTLLDRLKTLATSLANLPPYIPAAINTTIANAASLSDAQEIDGRLAGIVMPATWTLAAITFQGSLDGSNFFNIYDGDIERAISSSQATASKWLALDPADWKGVKFLKCRSGTSATPVNQGQQSILTLVNGGY
jgi:hypothetical protein